MPKETKAMKKLNKRISTFDPARFDATKWLEALKLSKDVIEQSRVEITKQPQYSAQATVSCDDAVILLEAAIEFSLKHKSRLIIPFLEFCLSYSIEKKKE